MIQVVKPSSKLHTYYSVRCMTLEYPLGGSIDKKSVVQAQISSLCRVSNSSVKVLTRITNANNV